MSIDHNFALIKFLIMKQKTKQKQYGEEDFSRVVEDAAIILQRKSDQVMNIKQVDQYLGISEGAVHKRSQRNQLPFHKSANKLYFSRLEVDNAILERDCLTRML